MRRGSKRPSQSTLALAGWATCLLSSASKMDDLTEMLVWVKLWAAHVALFCLFSFVLALGVETAPYLFYFILLLLFFN